ncbi:type II CAAX endopeptidase family protein, partial [Helicobacter typhlonius]|uniref:CPBP family intramembrane glutamic endopeptidase n=1 Tax=Helicobacter typhlonius TaxID=76936 RepID=UPI002FE159EC
KNNKKKKRVCVSEYKSIAIQAGLSLCLLVFACAVYYFAIFRLNGELVGLYPFILSLQSLLWLCFGFVMASVIMWIFLQFPCHKIYDENVFIFAKSANMYFMVPFFLINALAEELIFRGVLQYHFGLILATILFTLVHFSYYKKPLMLLEVCAQGLLLGFLYEMSESLWVCTLCHGGFNYFLLLLIKKDYVRYDDKS